MAWMPLRQPACPETLIFRVAIRMRCAVTKTLHEVNVTLLSAYTGHYRQVMQSETTTCSTHARVVAVPTECFVAELRRERTAVPALGFDEARASTAQHSRAYPRRHVAFRPPASGNQPYGALRRIRTHPDTTPACRGRSRNLALARSPTRNRAVQHARVLLELGVTVAGEGIPPVFIRSRCP